VEHQLHFEIVCDDANLRSLVNRQTGNLGTSASGRSDVVFGELYFRLPAGTEIYPVRPLDNNPVAHHQPLDVPTPQPLAAAQTTGEVLYVGLRYAAGNIVENQNQPAGDGVANQNPRDHAYVTTCRGDGTPHGVALVEANAEYDLYSRANAISQSYPAGGRPAPSAVYELLRFGRIIDTANVTLTPANVPHWRRIRMPAARVGSISTPTVFTGSAMPIFRTGKAGG
jgi:hydroxyethylthiazole kinase